MESQAPLLSPDRWGVWMSFWFWQVMKDWQPLLVGALGFTGVILTLRATMPVATTRRPSATARAEARRSASGAMPRRPTVGVAVGPRRTHQSGSV